MLNNKNIFFNKKILIYGLGKSGLSSFRYLKKQNKIYLYDDKKIDNKHIGIKKNIISYTKVINKNFDHIIVSLVLTLTIVSLEIF